MTKRGPHDALLRGSGPCCADLGQSWNRLEAVLKRSWAGLDAVSDRLGSQDGPKDLQGDTKDAPKRRHVGPGSAPDASRCHQEARKGDGEAQKY